MNAITFIGTNPWLLLSVALAVVALVVLAAWVCREVTEID